MPVLPTPFTGDGEIDCESFDRVIEDAADAGATAVVMFGLASEYYKLEGFEQDRITEILLRQSRSRIPVIISITAHATEIAVRKACAAERAGAEALMVLPPFFLNPPVEAVLQHVQAIRRATRLPLILQYAPAQTGISGDLLQRAQVDCVEVDAFPSFVIAGTPTLVGYMGLVSSRCSSL